MHSAGAPILFHVGVFLTARVLAQPPTQIIDCLTDHKNVECHEFYNKSVVSCYDYLRVGQRKSGRYPFLKEINGGKRIQLLRCDFDANFENATTRVHNALESYDVRAGIGFELARAGSQDRAWHIEYELEHEMVLKLEEASASCHQEILFNNCISYDALKSALRNQTAVLLSARGINLTEKQIAGHCSGGALYHRANLTSAVVSLGSKAASGGKSIQLSLEPLYCSGRDATGHGHCNYSFPAAAGAGQQSFAIAGSASDHEISFQFRTLSYDTQLVNVQLDNSRWVNISIAKGWLLGVAGVVHNESLAPSLLSDGFWHTFRLRQRNADLLINIDTLIHIWRLPNFPRLSSLQFDSGFSGCVSDLKINDQLRCGQNQTTSNKQQQRSLCDHQICNPGSVGPCTPRADCLCRCAEPTQNPEGKLECGTVGDGDHTVTFFGNGKLKEGNSSAFIWVDKHSANFSTSFHFRTRKATGLLAYLLKSDWSLQIALRDESIEAYLCHLEQDPQSAQPPDLFCDSCSVSRGKGPGFNDFSWHYVAFEDRTPSNHSQAFLLTSAGACRLDKQLKLPTTAPTGVYVLKTNGANREVAYFGGVPEECHLRKDGSLATGGYANFLVRGPENFAGCMSFHNLRQHFSNSANQAWHNTFSVSAGCSDPDPCSNCGKGIPCVGSDPSMNCNCSSNFLVQDDLRPNQCRKPRPVKQSLQGEPSCIATQDVPILAPYRNSSHNFIQFSLLWFSFKIVPPFNGKSAKISTSMHRRPILTVDLQASSSFQFNEVGSGHILLQIPPSFLNSTRDHVFILRRLARSTLELQINNKRIILNGGSLSAWVDQGLVFDFADTLCVSHFVVQYKNQDGEPPVIIELDNPLDLTGISYTSHRATITDFSVLESDPPSLRLQDTPYPPKPLPPSAQTTESRGFPYWVIGVIIAILVLIVLILGVVIYFARFRRRYRSHTIPTTDSAERYRSRDSDEEETEVKKPASIRKGRQVARDTVTPAFLLPKLKNESRGSPIAPTSAVPSSGIPKSANERPPYQPLIKSDSPRTRMPMIDDEDETGSLPSLNYSLSLDDQSLTLTLDTPPPEPNSFVTSALQAPNSNVSLCKFNEFSDIL